MIKSNLKIKPFIIKMECQFCEKIISTKGNLNYHQKTSKTCLKIQQKKSERDIEIDLTNCDYCNKSFSTQNFRKHSCKNKIIFETKKEKDLEFQKILKEKDLEFQKILEKKDLEFQKILKEKELEFQRILEKKDLEIQKLQTEIKLKDEIYKDEHKTIRKLALQPKTTTTNNNTNNIVGSFNMNDTEKIKNIIQNEFSIDDIIEGQKGLAKFAVNKILKDEQGNLCYICTDPSRKIFKYKNIDGKVVKDVDSQKLTNAFIDSEIKNITNCKTMTYWTKDDGSQDSEKFSCMSLPASEIMNLKFDNSSFRDQLVVLTSS